MAYSTDDNAPCDICGTTSDEADKKRLKSLCFTEGRKV